MCRPLIPSDGGMPISTSSLCAHLAAQVTAVRTIHASRGDVFAAWTRPELITRWAVDSFHADPRPGGQYRQITRDDGGEHIVSGEYGEFVPDERLVMTWSYQSPEPGNRSEAVVTVVLDELTPDTTEETVTETPVAADDAPASARAWNAALDALAALLEANSPDVPEGEPS
jgi:uncharacterized protein YndB with AHSA1/START domain